MSMYADDTSLCYQSHDLTRLNEAINSDLRKLNTWLQGNELSLHVAKTHSVLISRIITTSSFDAQSRRLIKELGWNTVDELITDESKAMVFNFFHFIFIFNFFRRVTLQQKLFSGGSPSKKYNKYNNYRK